MAEADTYRRYYSHRCERLRKWNTGFVVATWAMSLTATLLGLGGLTTWSIGTIIVSAAIMTLRDVLRLSDRVADCRAIINGINNEYDTLRTRWITGGQYNPTPEIESFHRVSWFTNLVNESVNQKMLLRAETESSDYHKHVEAPNVEAFSPSTDHGS